ncbi:MAG: pilus assembly protein MshP [Proteiniphilum sp.]|nr:pilus assembly protein MshP [Proteiniphilum sp.]
MRPDLKPPRRSGPEQPCPRTRTTQKHRGHGPLLQGRKQHGFGLVAAVFLIIVIAGAIAVMWRLSVTQSTTNTLSLQQARAFQAARAGLEYGIARSLASPSQAYSSFNLEGFQVVVIYENSTVPQASVPEEGRDLIFHRVEATATYGSPGDPDYAYRQLTAVVEGL